MLGCKSLNRQGLTESMSSSSGASGANSTLEHGERREASAVGDLGRWRPGSAANVGRLPQDKLQRGATYRVKVNTPSRAALSSGLHDTSCWLRLLGGLGSAPG